MRSAPPLPIKPELNSTVADPPGRWAFLVYAAPCAVAWTTYLILHWPGMLSNDSVGEWISAVGGLWLDNPIMMQFMIWLVTRVWFSPGPVLLVCIAAFAGVIGLALARQRAFGLPRSLAWMTSLGIALFPTHMRVTTWLLNDLPYTISMVALTVVTLEIVQSKGAWLKRGHSGWLLLGLAAALTALYRHNGPPVGFLTLACLLLVFNNAWRRMAAAIMLAVILFVLVKWPLTRILEARPYLISAKPTLISSLFIWPIVAHLSAGTPMTPEDRAVLDEWDTLGFFTEGGKKYRESLIYPVNPVPFYPFPFAKCDPLDLRIIRVWANLTLTAPMITLQHHAQVSSFLWRLRAGTNNTFLLLTPDGAYLVRRRLPPPSSGLPGIGAVSDTEPFGPRWSAELMQWSNSPRYEWLFWRAGTWTCIILLVLVPALIRTRRWSYALVLAPAFINSAFLAILANVPEFRHAYPMVIVSQLFLLFFASMALGPRGMIKVPPGNADE